MKFRTAIELNQSQHHIDHSSKLILLGSCFAESIGNKLIDSKFDACINPLSISYNPVSIKKHLDYVLENRINENDVFEHNEVFSHYDFHSDLSSNDKNEILTNIEDSLVLFKKQLLASTHIFLTFGTSFVFEHEAYGIVNNCHKMPSSIFNRRMLSLNELNTTFKDINKTLKVLAPTANVTYTISPIRHIRDGLIENQKSKSTLIASLAELSKELDWGYFASYEMMIDDLRDYRFYAADMIHPNEQAIQYIWGKFTHHFFNTKTNELNSKIGKIKTDLNHRPRFPKSNSYQNHVKGLLQKIEALDFLDYSKEKAHLSNLLKSF